MQVKSSALSPECLHRHSAVCIVLAMQLLFPKVRCYVLLQSLLPVPYFASERSFAQFRLPEDTKAVVGFGATNNSLVVVSTSGSFYTASFDHDKGGICKQDSFCKFVELDN